MLLGGLILVGIVLDAFESFEPGRTRPRLVTQRLHLSQRHPDAERALWLAAACGVSGGCSDATAAITSRFVALESAEPSRPRSR
jgi:hypothetical protein